MAQKGVYSILFEKYQSLLVKPKHFFHEVKKEHTYHPAMFFLISLILVSSIINILITLPLMIQKIGSFVGVTWPAQLLTILYLPIYGVVQASLIALIIFVILTLFKVKHNKYLTNFKVVAYTQTISLIYAIIGTVLVLAVELLTSQSINEMLYAVFSGSLASASAMAIVYLFLAIPLTIISWVHTLWAMMHGFTEYYDLKKVSAVLLSIFSLLASFFVLMTIITQIPV